MKSGELAARLGMSDSVIRKWSGQYAAHLSAGAGHPQPGQEREFNERDQLIMATVSQLRLEGRSHAEIEQEIASGWHIEHLPPMPDPEVQEARSKISLVPVDRLQRAIDRIDALENEVERLISERDRALAAHDSDQQTIAGLRAELARLEERASHAADRLEEQMTAITGIPTMQERIADLREQLAEARAQAAGVQQTAEQLVNANNAIQHLQRMIGQLQQALEEEKSRKRGWFNR